MKMLVPLSNHVILKKEEQKNSTKSGIILTSKEQVSNEGVVESVGPEVKSEKIAANGRVIFKEYKAEKVRVDDTDYYIVEDKDIIAVVE
jgi:chaperonin GroES